MRASPRFTHGVHRRHIPTANPATEREAVSSPQGSPSGRLKRDFRLQPVIGWVCACARVHGFEAPAACLAVSLTCLGALSSRSVR